MFLLANAWGSSRLDKADLGQLVGALITVIIAGINQIYALIFLNKV